jgi:hypothetical protein
MTLFTDAHRCASEGARPFASAEDAWIWTMAALMARRDGAGPVIGFDAVARPCEPDDVVKCLDRLYRHRRIDLAHVRILRIWGERQRAPDPARALQRGDARLWREALGRLAWPLMRRGIITEATMFGTDDAPANGEEMWLASPAPPVPTATTTVCG